MLAVAIDHRDTAPHIFVELSTQRLQAGVVKNVIQIRRQTGRARVGRVAVIYTADRGFVCE